MFYFLCFFRSIGCSIVDLVPPFSPDENSVGEWKLFGHSIATEDRIVLVPPIQHRIGSLWTNAEFPATGWSILFNIKIIQPQFHGGFCIWYNKKLIPKGPFYGGPPKLDGIAIIGDISERDYERVLEIHMIQSSGSDDLFTAVLPEPCVTYGLADEEVSITLKLSLKKGEVLLYGGEAPDMLTLIDQQELQTDVTHNYIGISASTGEFASGIEIDSIIAQVNPRIKQDQSKSKTKREVTNMNYDSYDFQKSPNEIFRTVKLNYFTSDIQKANDNNYDTSLFANTNRERVFDSIEVLLEVVSTLAKQNDLVNFVENSIGNFSSKWAKRKVKLINSIPEMNHSVSNTCNQTDEMVRVFKETVHDVLTRSTQKAISLGDIVSDMNGYEVGVDDSVTSVGFSTFIQLLLFVAILESLFVVVLLMYSQYSSNINGSFSYQRI
ncbi:Legume-like lectin family protein [Histomonas meleagridis]|uniref:Legume-like lectin family protein n=1 Tax=Histomonas meleagridis TaxID=135588 RepID=UPI00355A0E33|nr:Legume-like lectin family protein [Histomonas meleagridis]KAH0800501.1 Legume-like lectin family protein [Histomonas meleagridis]